MTLVEFPAPPGNDPYHVNPRKIVYVRKAAQGTHIFLAREEWLHTTDAVEAVLDKLQRVPLA